MAAQPAFAAAVDDDDDDGFDWDAAVREIDEACALASAAAAASSSAPAPAPAPVQPRPGPSATAPPRRPPAAAAGAGARQSTLDRFVDSFTRRQREVERDAPAPSAAAAGEAPPGGGPARPRPAEEKAVEDRFVESFTRRQQEKERAAPQPPPPRPPPAAAAAPPARGRGRPGFRAGKASARRVVREVTYDPCAVALDHEAVQTWIYPMENPVSTWDHEVSSDRQKQLNDDINQIGKNNLRLPTEANIEVREYQKYMVEKALFTNTLVALPTGLGKTFIAAVVMYNYFRWFPEGKIVFAAPTRPLVIQQIEACHNTVGIPQEWAIDMTGKRIPSERSCFWKSKRVFFVTPQILANDIQSGICKANQIVCLVIDEAHKASGNYAYCNAVRELVAAHVPLRILALTATPGSKHVDIQNVIDNLYISELVHRDEEDSEVSGYVNTRQVEVLEIPFGSDTTQVHDMLLEVMRPHLNRLRDAAVIDNRDYANWNSYDMVMYKDKFNNAPPQDIPQVERVQIQKSFLILCSLCHMRKLLLSHGVLIAYEFLENKLKKGVIEFDGQERTLLAIKREDEVFLLSRFESKNKEINKGDGWSLQNKNGSKNSRVIIFSHFRGSVKEICCSLQTIDERLIRPVEFIGQSSADKRLKGQTQKTQQTILQKFRSGEYNVLVATSIGEEGLDIIEVDLVVCFDANVSPLRMIQRMGRTGRKNAGREVTGYKKKQRDSQTMRKLLRNSERFEYHASPRMVPHVFKPEIKYVKMTIERYIPCSKKRKVAIQGASPILRTVSEQDSQLIARYFGAGKEDVWRPSLVAFPRFQLSPSVVHKVPHSFRTTDMLIDAMHQLQDLSYIWAKCESPLQEPADVAAVKRQACKGLYAVNVSKEARPQECDVVEDTSKEVEFDMPRSPVKMHPIHAFFSGNHVTVDNGGNVLITFVPVLPQTYAPHKYTENEACHRVSKMAVFYKSAAGISKPTVELDHPAFVTDSGEHLFVDNATNLPPLSPEYAGKSDDAEDYVLAPPPSKILTSPGKTCYTPCNAKLEGNAFSCQEDMEFSPRLTHYMEEGIVPESPVLDVSHLQRELDVGSVSKSVGGGTHSNVAACQKGHSNYEENDKLLSGVTERASSLEQNVLNKTQRKTEESVCPANEKICTPTTEKDLLCDSFSTDCQLKSGGDKSLSVQQAPKFRRLCKYGDKIKRISISLDGCREGFRECGNATITIPNQMGPAMGKKGKAKRRLDTYIDEEVEVSEDADVSEDEDDDQSEDKYEDSFINDQETPCEFTQTEQAGGNNGDMMGFYRRSLLTQSPIVLPSRYRDMSDDSASRTGNTSCSSEVGHNYISTPKEISRTHHSIDPSPSCYQQRSLERASFIKEQSEKTVVNCESSTKPDCRKRKLSFQQSASIPVINLEPEPAPLPSSHIATETRVEVNDDAYLDDDFFEGLDLDAIEAQATEMWRQKNSQSEQTPVETKKASEISFAPPSFDLGF
ncbi:hypothetical protein ACP4OV_014644 [Aristida adscensionis]